MWGWLPGRWLSGPLYGSGPAGAAPGGRLGGRPCLVGLFSRGGWLSGAGMRDTPAAACWVVVGAPACVGVWGWHAVGVLGQCALVAWPVLLLPVGGWWGVGVGGLVVNCIVDASILL